jgi:hypothetical protein
MIARIFFFLLGFGLSVIGFTYAVGYLNLLTMGYSFVEYIVFISKRSECIIAVIGFLLITFSIFKGDNKNDIYL